MTNISLPLAETFPRQLLKEDPTTRLAYFQQKVIAHPLLVEADQMLMSAIQSPAETALIFVIGPSGVGKTTLRLRAERKLIEAALPELTQYPGQLPSASMEAIPPESGYFSWRDYYTRALLALREPGQLIAYKSAMDTKDDATMRLLHRTHPRLFGATCGVAELRRALELCLLHRRPRAFFVDEAQHLKKVSSGRRLLDQLDILKSLAGMTQTLHVLVGTYELCSLTNLSAQLGRRSIVVHLRRYHHDQNADMHAFKRVVLTFQRHLPVAEEPNWVEEIDYLYERCGGCVGALKSWFQRALALALERGDKTITRRHLDRVIDATGVLQMAREINQGEALWQETDAHQHELRRLLGMRQQPSSSAPQNPSPPRQPRRVGQRKPVRDPAHRQEAQA